RWLAKTARAPAGVSPSKAMPPKSIPTFSTENIARKGFFYAGGAYWGERGKEVMRGAMYTEVWIPKQIRHAEPIVFFHGNGQTGVDWQQTRSEEHTSELQSPYDLVCRLLLEKKNEKTP